jgi:poly(3-hydroxybutyrate) depolymerase
VRKLLDYAVLSCAFLLVIPALGKNREKVTSFTFQFADKTRTVYTVIPQKEAPMPLVILLHGSGRNGEIMASKWKDLALREEFIVAAPDAYNAATWDSGKDTPEFFRNLVEQVKSRHAVESSRIYLFGHSAGAAYALFLTVIDSDLFAATAIHAGALQTDPNGLFEQAKRNAPIAIWVGDHDAYFPVDQVMETKRIFESNGYKVELSVILGHDHNYYAIAGEINSKAWNFLKKTHLDGAQSEFAAPTPQRQASPD